MAVAAGDAGQKWPPGPVLHSLAGFLSGMFANLATYPLDFVKVRYIAQDGSQTRALDGVARFRNIFHAIQISYSAEGLLSMYQGVGASLYASSVSWAVYFGAYRYCQSMCKAGAVPWIPASSPESSSAGRTGDFASATAAGVAATVLSCPLWLVKTRIMLQRGACTPQGFAVERYSGTLHGLRHIWRHEGVRGLYSGLVPSLMLVSHGSIQMTLYESLKKALQSARQKSEASATPPRLTSAEITACTLGSKCVASMFTTPLVVLRIRVQDPRNSLKGVDVSYGNVVRAVLTIVEREGVAGLYRGLVPTLVRTLPTAVLTFLCYEHVSHLLFSSFHGAADT
ncbi:Folate transporter 1 [Diplonema papillatum]|nr:Folate transporter 1 [Diplonema papillatum]